MYRVGIKEGSWVLITDGNEIYSAENDVRHHSGPQSAEDYSRGLLQCNRIYQLNLTRAELERHCASNNIAVRGCITTGEKAKQISGPAAVGGVVGALVGGPVGAVVGAGIAGGFSSLMASTTGLEQDNIIRCFAGAKAGFNRWKLIDEHKKASDQEEKAKYRSLAEKDWRRYYKLKNLASVDELDGIEFEVAIAGLYESKGYSVEMTKASGDYGVDLLAKKGTEILAIQAKRYSEKVGIQAVQEASSGALYYKANKTVVITNSFFTDPAKELAKKIGVTLMNKKHLANMWESYNPSTSVPPFDMQKYESIKREIDRELFRIDSAAGRTMNKGYTR